MQYWLFCVGKKLSLELQGVCQVGEPPLLLLHLLERTHRLQQQQLSYWEIRHRLTVDVDVDVDVGDGELNLNLGQMKPPKRWTMVQHRGCEIATAPLRPTDAAERIR